MMMRAIRLLAGGLALVSGIWAVEASSAELKVLSAGAMRAAVQELAPAFEAAFGNKLKIEYANVGDIEKRSPPAMKLMSLS
jgi:ABC-type molybdate transport system substrate-binding protein